jgi:hypothetical protein
VGGAQEQVRRRGFTLILLDETGHTFRALTGLTWARLGHTPQLLRVSKRREVSSIVA